MNSDISRSIRVGLFFLFGSILIWIVHETFTEANLYSEAGYMIKAPFENLKQLKLGSDVRLAGLSIGAVTDLRLEGDKAVAELSIERDFKVPIDSIATITTAGLLGNNYVSIQSGGGDEYLIEGDTITTKETADISEVISNVGDLGDKISKFLDDMSGEGSGGMLGSVNKMVDEVSPKLNKALDNIVQVSESLNSKVGTLGKLINEDKAYNELLVAVDDIKAAAKDASAFFGDAKTLVGKFGNGHGPLDFILNDKEAAIQLKDSVANINEFSKSLNNSDSTLGKLIKDDSLYREAKTILGKVGNAVDGIENSGPITAVGVTAGALF